MLGQQWERRRCQQQESQGLWAGCFVCTVLVCIALIGSAPQAERQARTFANRAGQGLGALHIARETACWDKREEHRGGAFKKRVLLHIEINLTPSPHFA